MLLSAITLYSQVNRWEYSKNYKKLDVVKWPGFETTDNLLLVPNSLTISFVRWSEVANFENYVDQVHSKNICLLLCLVSKWGLRKGVIVWSQAFKQSVLQSETDDQLTTISCAISSANFKLQVVLNKIFQKIVFSKSTSILPINYI